MRAECDELGEVNVTVVAGVVAVVVSSLFAARGNPWSELLVVVVGVGLLAGVMLLKGYDRRKTLQEMPLNTVFVETDWRGRQTLIVRGPARPVHLLLDDEREALDT